MHRTQPRSNILSGAPRTGAVSPSGSKARPPTTPARPLERRRVLVDHQAQALHQAPVHPLLQYTLARTKVSSPSPLH